MQFLSRSWLSEVGVSELTEYVTEYVSEVAVTEYN